MSVIFEQTRVVIKPGDDKKEYAHVPPRVAFGSFMGVVIKAAVELVMEESMVEVAESQPPETIAPPIAGVTIDELAASWKSPLNAAVPVAVVVVPTERPENIPLPTTWKVEDGCVVPIPVAVISPGFVVTIGLKESAAMMTWSAVPIVHVELTAVPAFATTWSWEPVRVVKPRLVNTPPEVSAKEFADCWTHIPQTNSPFRVVVRGPVSQVVTALLAEVAVEEASSAELVATPEYWSTCPTPPVEAPKVTVIVSEPPATFMAYQAPPPPGKVLEPKVARVQVFPELSVTVEVTVAEV